MPDPAIQIEGLTRVYNAARGWFRREQRRITALNGIDLTIEQGELFGILGPNGAGKTTLCKILGTILLPTSGRVRILGFDPVLEPDAVRQRVRLVLGGDRGLYTHLSVRDNLLFWGALYQMPRAVLKQNVAQALETLGLASVAGQLVEQLSRGMRQRLHLARALLSNPSLLLLDEPTIGLDPVAARSLREVIRDLKQWGMTIVMTTHYMQEVEELCDRIAVIDRGEIRYLGTVERLKAQTQSGNVLKILAHRSVLARVREIRTLPGVHGVSWDEKGDVVDLAVGYEADASLVSRIIELLGAEHVRELHTRTTTLEDAYVEMIGNRGLEV